MGIVCDDFVVVGSVAPLTTSGLETERAYSSE